MLLIQGDSEGKVNIFGGDDIGHCEKTVHVNMCLSMNGYRNTALLIYAPNCVTFLCVGLDVQRSLRKIKVDTPDEPLASILDAAASIKKRMDQPRRETRSSHKSCEVR